MTRLALFGTCALALLSGCPTSHGTVRSCAEASTAPDGTPCEGFFACDPPTACALAIECSDGVVLRVGTLGCDGGRTDASRSEDASVDAGIDAGPCAPRPPVSGRGCHGTSECNPVLFEMCFAPGASRGCGVCLMATRTCATDADCASTDYCESYVDPCSHPGACGNGSDVTSTRCVPRCTASSCPAGSSCEPASGRCVADPCVGGAFVCPAHTHCQDTAGGDPHGCARDSCAFDADCGCGAACLSGLCYDTLGSCESPAA